MSSELQAALLGALAGALAGGLASFWLNSFQDWWRVRRVSKRMRLLPEARAGSRLTARVVNDSHYAVRGAVAYISIDHTPHDVLPPPLHFAAYVSPQHLRIVREDRLCWSARTPTPNPMSIDIYAGEHQSLDLLDLGAQSLWIEIPSEEGYSSSQTPQQAATHGQIASRVFLRSDRRYRATIRIVSADTKAGKWCRFELEIDPSNTQRPITLVR